MSFTGPVILMAISLLLSRSNNFDVNNFIKKCDIKRKATVLFEESVSNENLAHAKSDHVTKCWTGCQNGRSKEKLNNLIHFLTTCSAHKFLFFLKSAKR